MESLRAETLESHLSSSAALGTHCPFSRVPRLPCLTDECDLASSRDGILGGYATGKGAICVFISAVSIIQLETGFFGAGCCVR